jgi:hypothetical protein
MENQAADLARRIWQKSLVLVGEFVRHGTLEEEIDAMIEAKRGLTDGPPSVSTEMRLTRMKDDELPPALAPCLDATTED